MFQLLKPLLPLSEGSFICLIHGSKEFVTILCLLHLIEAHGALCRFWLHITDLSRNIWLISHSNGVPTSYIYILVLRLSSYTFQYIMLQKWVEVLMFSQTFMHCYIFVHINVQMSEVYSLDNILSTSNVICGPALQCDMILAIYSLENQ